MTVSATLIIAWTSVFAGFWTHWFAVDGHCVRWVLVLFAPSVSFATRSRATVGYRRSIFSFPSPLSLRFLATVPLYVTFRVGFIPFNVFTEPTNVFLSLPCRVSVDQWFSAFVCKRPNMFTQFFAQSF